MMEVVLFPNKERESSQVGGATLSHRICPFSYNWAVCQGDVILSWEAAVVGAVKEQPRPQPRHRDNRPRTVLLL
jgi:hypothetical protein